MKTISFYSLVLFVAMLVCGGFTACSDDEEGGPEEEVKTTGKFDFSFSLGDDLLELANVEVTFIDAAGKKTTEEVTAFPWKKTVTFENVPVTVGYKVNVTAKTGIELTKDKYQVSDTYSNVFYALQGDKVVTVETLVDVSSTLTVPKDKMEQLMSTFSGSYAYKVGADYSCSKTELEF